MIYAGRCCNAGPVTRRHALPPRPAATTCHHDLPPRPAATTCRHDLPPRPAATTCRHDLPPRPAATTRRHDPPPRPAATTRRHNLPPQPAATTRRRDPSRLRNLAVRTPTQIAVPAFLSSSASDDLVKEIPPVYLHQLAAVHNPSFTRCATEWASRAGPPPQPPSSKVHNQKQSSWDGPIVDQETQVTPPLTNTVMFEDDPEVPGEDDPEVPGEDDPEVPGEDDPEVPGEDDLEVPGEDDPEVPGQDARESSVNVDIINMS
ncbi:proteoglycan 4-like [Procambarus clarkii]|uniref:proteoglycan 4-like n=1 Tax=Procambarus clarkii TaxID=6728 RepID=UPI003743A52A